MNDERIALRLKCDRSRHVVGTVTGGPGGYVVTIRELVLTGYGNQFEVVPTTIRLDGTVDDPEAWTTMAGCKCGHQFVVDSLAVRLALADHRRVVVLAAWDRTS